MLRDYFPATVLGAAKTYFADAASLALPHDCPIPIDGVELTELYKQTSWLVAGLAVVADWLGSNTKWFPYRQADKSIRSYWEDVALQRARVAVAESGLAAARPAKFRGFRHLFKGIAKPTPLQTYAQHTQLSNGPQLFILEELTGGGKTEAALTLAARLNAAGLGNGVYIALPTMATADAMFDRLRDKQVHLRFFKEGSPSLVLAHSADRLKLALEEANRQDSGYGDHEVASASKQCAEWLSDNRKKALLGDFGVGTIDQALLAVLSARHQSLRLLGLSTKVLIVDEVHACDAYMGELPRTATPLSCWSWWLGHSPFRDPSPVPEKAVCVSFRGGF